MSVSARPGTWRGTQGHAVTADIFYAVQILQLCSIWHRPWQREEKKNWGNRIRPTLEHSIRTCLRDIIHQVPRKDGSLVTRTSTALLSLSFYLVVSLTPSLSFLRFHSFGTVNDPDNDLDGLLIQERNALPAFGAAIFVMCRF